MHTDDQTDPISLTPTDTPEGIDTKPGDDAPEPSPIEALEQELTHVKDHMLRAMADAENIRRRAEREKEDASKYAVTSFARELLIVADNLRRGLDAVSDEDRASIPSLNGILAGFELTEKSLLSAFEKAGIRSIHPLHEPFDPHHHQAVFEQPNSGYPAGTVTQVLQTGFVIHDRLLRPAMVAVAKEGA